MSFGSPSDGILRSRRGCRAETRRGRRPRRKKEDVVIGSCENVKRTHPSGRQHRTSRTESTKATHGDITQNYHATYIYGACFCTWSLSAWSDNHCHYDNGVWKDICALTFGERRNYCVRKEVRKFQLLFFSWFLGVSAGDTAEGREVVAPGR